MPPKGSSTMPARAATAPTAAPAPPEFMTSDLYGQLIADTIERGRQVIAAETTGEGRRPSVADQIADQMRSRAVTQLVHFHGLPTGDEPEQEHQP